MQPGNVHEVFQRVAAAHPQRTAIEQPGRTLTYAELDARAGHVAAQLTRRGVAAGSRVAILAADRASVASSMLGTLHMGCAFVPLDPALPQARLAALLQAADCAAVMADTSQLGLARDLGVESPIAIDDGPPALPPPPPASWGPDDLCYLYFTSGSTGVPKAIAGRMCAIDHFIRWEASFVTERGAPEGEGLRVSQLTTPSFDAFLRDLFLPLCNGGTLCVPPWSGATGAMAREPAALLAWLDEARVAVLHCVPSVFRLLLDAGLGARSLPSLRCVLLAGEALRHDDARRWLSAMQGRAALVNLYGPSETTMVKLYHVVSEADLSLPSIPIGRPMAGAEVVLFGDDGAPVAEGRIGEIGIRTRYRALGYFRQPALTERAFLPDGLYKTGDHGRYLDDGELLYLGRRDRQVKLSGVRVELDEVELLLRRCPGVLEAAVDARGEAEQPPALLAWVRLAPGATIDTTRGELSRLLPDVMLPSAIMQVEKMPRTISGKLDRRALPDPRAVNRDKAPPRTDAERALAALWEALLGLTGVGADDDFFSLGGNSLLAAQMVARVRAKLGRELSLARVLQERTLSRIAGALERAASTQASADEAPIQKQGPGPFPLSFSQATLFTIDLLIGPTGALNLYVGHRIRGPLDHARLEQAIGALHRRHPMLRARFSIGAGAPVQRVDDSLAPPFERVDLRSLEPSAQASTLEARSASLVRSGLLGRAPLPAWSATHFVLSDDESCLVVVMHHVISDGASLAIFCRELGALYAGAPLPPLPLDYVDHAVWIRQQMAGERLRGLLAHETARLGGKVDYLDLPTDRPQPLIPDMVGARASIELSRPLLRALSGLAEREAATLFMVLHGAFQLVLGSLCNASRVLLPSPVAARPRPELEGVIGVFMNVVVIGVEAPREQSFVEFLRRVRLDALDALANETMPFELLNEALPAGVGSRHPLVQVSFNLQNMGSYDLTLPGLKTERLPLDNGVATFDLNLLLEENERGMQVTASYAASLFDAATIEAMLASYRALLEAIAHNPDTSLSALPLPARRPPAPPPAAPSPRPPPPAIGHHDSLPPLLFVPPPGGVDCYAHLASRLRWPSIRLPSEQLWGSTVDRARALASFIKTTRPRGPHLLCAWSLGGPLAMALSRALGSDRTSLVVLLDAPAQVAPHDVEAHAARQLANLALHRCWKHLDGDHGDEISAHVERALASIARGDPPQALASLWRIVCFALGADGRPPPDEHDAVTLGLLGNVFGRQLGLVDRDQPGAELDPAAALEMAVGAARWLGIIEPSQGKAELLHRALSFRAEVGALRLHRPATIANSATVVSIARAKSQRGSDGGAAFTAPGGHLGMMLPPHVDALAAHLDDVLSAHQGAAQNGPR